MRDTKRRSPRYLFIPFSVHRFLEYATTQNLLRIDSRFIVEVHNFHLDPIKVQYVAQLMSHKVKLAVNFPGPFSGF